MPRNAIDRINPIRPTTGAPEEEARSDQPRSSQRTSALSLFFGAQPAKTTPVIHAPRYSPKPATMSNPATLGQPRRLSAATGPCWAQSSCQKRLHMRGEQTRPAGRASWRLGAPPRAWRADYGSTGSRGAGRSTSTCVETSWRGRQLRSWTAEHLHVRGDQSAACDWPPPTNGAPPRAWRPARRGAGSRARSRSTSTCVETSSSRAPSRPTITEHLHVRGDQVDPQIGWCLTYGAPPRAWRAGNRSRVRCKFRRSTSTCVESRWRRGRCGRCITEHLHVRGEQTP